MMDSCADAIGCVGLFGAIFFFTFLWTRHTRRKEREKAFEDLQKEVAALKEESTQRLGSILQLKDTIAGLKTRVGDLEAQWARGLVSPPSDAASPLPPPLSLPPFSSATLFAAVPDASPDSTPDSTSDSSADIPPSLEPPVSLPLAQPVVAACEALMPPAAEPQPSMEALPPVEPAPAMVLDSLATDAMAFTGAEASGPLPEGETVAHCAENVPEPAPPVGMHGAPSIRPAPPLPEPQDLSPKPVAPPKPPFDWESLIGVKLFSWIAGIALLVAAVAFLKYSLEHGWLAAPVRMAIGLITGAGLLGFCETQRARQYAVTAYSLTAAGIATLFTTLFASTTLWHLMPPWLCFLCMALVAALAVLLSIRRNSIFIALLGLLGGFLTPMLLSTGQDNPLGLFGYLTLLNVGLAWVAYRKQWPLLKALSLLFTTLYQLGWVIKFLEASKLGIGLGVFLLFPVIAFGSLLLGARRGLSESEERHPLFKHGLTLSAMTPLLFALHVATTPAYGNHYAMMFCFLLLVTVGLSMVAVFRGPDWLHTLSAASTLIVWVGWLSRSYVSSSWPVLLLFVLISLLLYLGVPCLQARSGKAPFNDQGQLAKYAAPLLLMVFPALLALEPATASPWVWASALLLFSALLAADAIREQDSLVYDITCFFVVLAELVWSSKYLVPERLIAGLTLYGLFALFTLGVPWLAHARGRAFQKGHWVRYGLLALPPLIFSTTCLCSPTHNTRFVLLFSFLALVIGWVGFLGKRFGLFWLQTLCGAFALLGWFGWMMRGYRPEAWPGLLGMLALFVGIFLAFGATHGPQKAPQDQSDRMAVYTAPLLLFVFPLLTLKEPLVAAPGWLFGGLFGLMVALSTYAIRFEEGFVHFGGCFFVLLTEAVWSGKYLGPHNLMPALAIYGGFGLFYLGLPLYAQSKGKSLQPAGSGAILAFLSLGLIFFMTLSTRVAAVSLWPMAVLVGLLNLGLLYEASQNHYPKLCLAGMVVSWILMGCWWFRAPLEGMLVPALTVMGGFGVLVVGGNVWLRHRTSAPTIPQPFTESGLFLGLAGHLFLLVVVVNPRLSLPPWPWLGVLFVLMLALGTASLFLRRGLLQLGSLLATHFVLLTWVGAHPFHDGWTTVALWPSVLFALLGYGWDEVVRRRPAKDDFFTLAAFLGVLLAHLSLVVLGLRSSETPFVGLVIAHVCLVLVLLRMIWRRQCYEWCLALPAVMLVVLLAWRFSLPPGLLSVLWRQEWLFAGVFYGLLLAFPLLLGNRGKETFFPFLAALAGSVVFFLASWEALVNGGYKGVIGALPVVQALLLVPHLRLLLRMEPPGQRDLGRLAAVAGGILAFITVAIPLQLDQEWITIGWALLGVALAWLYTSIPHKGLLLWTAGLFAIVFARLVLNPAVFTYHPRSGMPVWNWYLYTYLVSSACFFGAGRLLRQRDDHIEGLPRLSFLLPAGGAIILFLLLNIEIADAFSTGEALTFNLFKGSLAQQLSYTIGWGIYAIGLLVSGVVSNQRITRIAAIVMLTVTVVKAFLLDLRQLTGLYRVASFVGLAICLTLVAVVLQKFVLPRHEGKKR